MTSRFQVHEKWPSGILDPQLERVLKEAEQTQGEPLVNLTPEQARRTLNQTIIDDWADPQKPSVARVEDQSIPGSSGPIMVRVYTPNGRGPFPMVLFIHGGGWVICSLDTHDNLCRWLCSQAECLVVSVDYRLSPETKFPGPLYDVYDAAVWLMQNAADLEGFPKKLAVAGDSAGGNLCAALSILAQDKGGSNIGYQLLMYPVTNLSSTNTHSYNEFGQGYMLTKEDMQWYIQHYLSEKGDAFNPYASPLLCSDLKTLPPVHVVTAEFDVLRDEGEAYAAKLHQAGVAVKCTRYNGVIHGFLSMDGLLDKSKEALQEIAVELKKGMG